jgi:Sec-independent protein secretion pathway component TatC
MADAAALRPQHTHPIPLLAHLEELRKRLILSVIGVSSAFSRAGPLLTVFSLWCSNLLFRHCVTTGWEVGWCI